MDSMDKTATTNRLLTAIVILMTLSSVYFAKVVVLAQHSLNGLGRGVAWGGFFYA